MKLENFLSSETPKQNVSGIVAWESPSNIALVKYWGKKGEQLPANPSISFSLNKAKTITQVSYSSSKKGGFEFYFEQSPKPDFHPKLQSFFDRISLFLPIIKELKLVIHSENTFPHSTGIASSASAMSALALCLCDIERSIFPDSYTDAFFYQKASFIARLGSGSAARSVYGGFSSWGESQHDPPLSDFYASPITKIQPLFATICDTIIILSKDEKKVSSTAGHSLMHGHPFAASRFEQARLNHSDLQAILSKGNWNEFLELVETEALSLHAMMMTGKPSYFLMEPESLVILNKIRNLRETKGVSCCFTLDAGPNIHLLYPEKEKDRIQEFIQTELKPSFGKLEILNDSIGAGPVKII